MVEWRCSWYIITMAKRRTWILSAFVADRYTISCTYMDTIESGFDDDEKFDFITLNRRHVLEGSREGEGGAIGGSDNIWGRLGVD